jgi:hypothetical protein
MAVELSISLAISSKTSMSSRRSGSATARSRGFGWRTTKQRLAHGQPTLVAAYGGPICSGGWSGPQRQAQ